MADTEPLVPLADPSKPSLVSVDLGANGGTFAPTSASEAAQWVNKEMELWAWIQATSGGNFKQHIERAVEPLRAAHNATTEALRREAGSPQDVLPYLQTATPYLQQAYTNRGLPHSSTPLGAIISALRQRDPQTALGYLYTQLPETPSHELSGNLSTWRGYFMGMAERDGLGLPHAEIAAQEEALNDVRGRAETLIGDSKQRLTTLDRQFHDLCTRMQTVTEDSNRTAAESLGMSTKEHREAVDAHQLQMENIQQAFREKMALRAPVEYWESRKTYHEGRTKWLGGFSFGSLAVLALGLVLAGVWVLRTLNEKGQPDAWRLSLVVLLAVVGVWAVRLIVRMFLSHIHLATDASERVTMVKTYLSLVESGGALGDEDRKLILQAIFRPASDGLVKDEGMPHPMLELLTRTGGR